MSPSHRNLLKSHWPALAVFCVALVVYVRTLCPTVFVEGTGENIVAAWTLGRATSARLPALLPAWQTICDRRGRGHGRLSHQSVRRGDGCAGERAALRDPAAGPAPCARGGRGGLGLRVLLHLLGRGDHWGGLHHQLVLARAGGGLPAEVAGVGAGEDGGANHAQETPPQRAGSEGGDDGRTRRPVPALVRAGLGIRARRALHARAALAGLSCCLSSCTTGPFSARRAWCSPACSSPSSGSACAFMRRCDH